jgi:long-chain acyl-CoA synthetase
MMLHPGTIAAQTPDRPAVIFGDHVLTYGALDHDSRAIATMLHGNGIGQGDIIAMLVGNRPEFFSIAWAAQRSGLYYLPIPTRLTPTEIAYILADSGAQALFIDPDYANLADSAAANLSIARYGIDSPSTLLPEPPATEGGDMLYTSGTTGRPKGVRRPLSGDALGSDSKRIDRAKALFGLDRDSVFLSPAPLYHAAPLRFTMNLLRTGGTVVGMPKFDAAGALALIEKHRITHSQWVPTMFNRLLALPEAECGSFDLSSHHVAIHAGAPCAPDLKRRMINWWGPILHEYYSGTESVGFTHVTSAKWLERPGTVGQAYGCAMHILDDDGNPLPVGEIGAVYFEGKAGLAYHNDPAKTEAAHDARGWATMGDIGYLDTEGYLFLTDRRAFTIISGGVNIYPSEIEAALSSHPLVRDVAVFGIPDADLGESVFALVELGASETADSALAQELVDHCAITLAGFKLPRRIVFGSVNRTETGKIAKADLRNQHNCGTQGYAISPSRNNDVRFVPLLRNEAYNV